LAFAPEALEGRGTRAGALEGPESHQVRLTTELLESEVDCGIRGSGRDNQLQGLVCKETLGVVYLGWGALLG